MLQHKADQDVHCHSQDDRCRELCFYAILILCRSKIRGANSDRALWKRIDIGRSDKSKDRSLQERLCPQRRDKGFDLKPIDQYPVEQLQSDSDQDGDQEDKYQGEL